MSQKPPQENKTLDVPTPNGEQQRQGPSSTVDKDLNSLVKKVSLGEILANQGLSPQKLKSKIEKGRKGGGKTKGKYTPNPGLLAELKEQKAYKDEEPTGRHNQISNLNRAVETQEFKPEEDLGQVGLRPNKPG